jgi:hypothetical protein
MTTSPLQERAAVLALVAATRGEWHRTAVLIEDAGSALRIIQREWTGFEPFDVAQAEALIDRVDQEHLERYANLIAQYERGEVQVLTVLDDNYPINLRQVYNPASPRSPSSRWRGSRCTSWGHVLAGVGAGHGAEWKRACERLGLRRAMAAGQHYVLAAIAPEIRAEVVRLIVALVDGRPAFLAALSPVPVAPTAKCCPAGVGVRGGISRGKGSGSRLRLWVCGCEKPVRVRVASDDFRATCDLCGEAFRQEAARGSELPEASPPSRTGRLNTGDARMAHHPEVSRQPSRISSSQDAVQMLKLAALA